jgi:hypothetical protein
MRRDLTPLVTHLDGSGRFFRDRAIGRVFHPNTRSYREVSATDSVHLVVDAGHRVSVHVDRVSPLLVRSGRDCRYSLMRAIAHNVCVAVESLARLVRRQHGHQTCHLDCEIVWVPDDDVHIDIDEAPAVA